MRERSTTNINGELNAIERQIKYFEELKYEGGLNVYYGSGYPYPLSGLDEEDFYRIKDKIIEMLKDCYNKKSNEMIEFCKSNMK